MKGNHNLPLILVSLFLALASCQYHYVPDRKTWSEAQTYCRGKYTDLATIRYSSDMQSLHELSLYNNVKDNKSWIGLHNSQHDMSSKFSKWSSTITGCYQLCVVWYNVTWWAVPCNVTLPFYCSSSSSVQEAKTWMEAQSSCQLATKKTLESKGLLVNNDKGIWVNLHEGEWMWSDGARLSFTRWQSNMPPSRLNESCAALHNGGWETQDCTKRFPFFCHNMTMRKRLVRVKLEINSENYKTNATFQQALLDEIRLKLEEKMPTLITNITWMQEANGQIFYENLDEE